MGICYRYKSDRFRVEFKVNNKVHFIGVFYLLNDAIRARNNSELWKLKEAELKKKRESKILIAQRYFGISYNIDDDFYHVKLIFNNELHDIGIFKTIEQALKARNNSDAWKARKERMRQQAKKDHSRRVVVGERTEAQNRKYHMDLMNLARKMRSKD